LYEGLGLKNQQSGSDHQHQEFNIQQEDFPALPRPQSVNNKTSKFHSSSPKVRVKVFDGFTEKQGKPFEMRSWIHITRDVYFNIVVSLLESEV